jgi:hypothetical protein
LEVLPESFARIDWNKRMQVLGFLTNAKKKHIATSSSSEIREDEVVEEGKRSHKKASSKDKPVEVEEGDAQVLKEQKPSDVEVTALIIRIGDPIPTEHPLGLFPPRFTGFSKEFGGFILLENIRKIFAIIPGKPLLFLSVFFFFLC